MAVGAAVRHDLARKRSFGSFRKMFREMRLMIENDALTSSKWKIREVRVRVGK
jgi:hypothetical protein